jgi:LysM repeat protein
MAIHGVGGPGGVGGGQAGPHVKQHVVREGETLAAIGQHHGVGRQALADANPHLGGAEPKAGMSLAIPHVTGAWGDPHVAPHADTFEKASQNLFETLGGGQGDPPDPLGQSKQEVRALGGGFDATGVKPADTRALGGGVDVIAIQPPEARALGGGFDATGVHPQGYIHDGSTVGADDRMVKIQPGDDASVKIHPGAPGDERSIKIAPGDDRSVKIAPGEGGQSSPLEDVSVRFGPDAASLIAGEGADEPDLDADLGGLGKKGE